MYKQNKLRNFIRYYDYKLVFLLSLLITIGVFAIGSAKPSLQNRQIFGALAGVAIMIIVSCIDYHLICKFRVCIFCLLRQKPLYELPLNDCFDE